ncbi:small integral membrane protein 5 [Scomber scombrus]|uniref:Small integral membrane protein 5 n=1 Tax=Scomber scombrus TaxID=13677 RepID=A0AAV1PWX4_SCOSC
MEVKEEVLDILHKVWIKLQDLPQASRLELGAFFVLILFVATFLFMIVLSCVHCCCCGKPKYQASRVEPLQAI